VNVKGRIEEMVSFALPSVTIESIDEAWRWFNWLTAEGFMERDTASGLWLYTLDGAATIAARRIMLGLE
jgi:hypothetical protein